jgi:UDP-2,3-diacylglucosamine pyrophosphatase LpxH
MMANYDTLIVSDVHLGSSLSMAKELCQLLSTLTFKRLILLGDMFSDLNFSRLTKEHWEVISLIRKLSNPKRGIEVVWVEGNHDAGFTHVLEHFLGVKVYQQYLWEWGGMKCLAMHGHQFDGIFSSGNPWCNGILTELYLFIQKFKWFRKWLPKFIDRLHVHYQRLTDKVKEGAVKAAMHEGARHVFCGHTHQPIHLIQDGVEFWNTGCWVGGTATYVTLGDSVELHGFMTSK